MRIDVSQFATVAARAKDDKVAKKIMSDLRSGLRKAGQVGAKAAQDEVKKPPLQVGKRPRSTGLRAGIASGVKVTITKKGEHGVSAVIKSTGGGLDGGRKKLVRAWDKPGGWRHPVFAQYKDRSGLKKNIKAAKGDLRKSLRSYEKALGERDRSKAKWVVQKGRPYFRTAILAKQSVYDVTLQTALETATEDIARYLNPR